jgi:site-specific recombinase XerD
MARKGRLDRGLMQKKDGTGKVVWYVRLYHNGRERRFGSFPTKTQAREFYEKAKREQTEEKFQPERYQKGRVTVAELIDHHVSVSTVKNHQTEVYYRSWWKARMKGKRLNGITPRDLEEAQRDLLAKGLAPQTVLHYMKFLRHVLNKAVRDGSLERTPFAKVVLPKVNKGRLRYLSPEEERRLLNALGPTYSPWARLAILVGIRLNEQIRLQWADVDFEQGLLTLPQTKAGNVQYAFLNEEAQTILRTLQITHMNQGRCSPWIFPSKNPARHLDQRNFYARVFVPAVKAAGLEGVTWHTLRHTFASRLAMSGQTEGTIAALLRHSTTALVKRYAHLSPSHLKTAVETVANFVDRGAISNWNRDKNRDTVTAEGRERCVSG